MWLDIIEPLIYFGVTVAFAVFGLEVLGGVTFGLASKGDKFIAKLVE